MFRMVKPFVRRPVTWMLLVGLLIVVFAFSACGGSSGPATTVHVKENHGASATSDSYYCDPASITVNKGDTVNFINDSDENQDFDMGDAQKAGTDFVIAVNGSKT